MRFYLFIFFIIISNNIIAQNNIFKGTILDNNNEPLVGVNIYLSNNKSVGTVSDLNGNFNFLIDSNFPIGVTISGIGYETLKLSLKWSNDLNQKIILSEEILLGEEVVVSASLFEQNILTAPVSIEKLDILDIEQSSAANFYDELYKIKGVDMIVQILSMRFPNTRVFNGNTNY